MKMTRPAAWVVAMLLIGALSAPQQVSGQQLFSFSWLLTQLGGGFDKREFDEQAQKAFAQLQKWANEMRPKGKLPQGTGERYFVVLHHLGIGGSIPAMSTDQPDICPNVLVGTDLLMGFVDRLVESTVDEGAVEYFGVLVRNTNEGLCYSKQTSAGDAYCSALLTGSGNALVRIVLPGPNDRDDMKVIIDPLKKVLPAEDLAPLVPPKVPPKPAEKEDLAPLPPPRPVPSLVDLFDHALKNAVAKASSSCGPGISTSGLVDEYLSGETLVFELPPERDVAGTDPGAARWQHARALHWALESSHTYTQGLDDKPWAEGHHYTMYVVRTKSDWTIEPPAKKQ
jgi:hypothetical protein